MFEKNNDQNNAIKQWDVLPVSYVHARLQCVQLIQPGGGAKQIRHVFSKQAAPYSSLACACQLDLSVDKCTESKHQAKVSDK